MPEYRIYPFDVDKLFKEPPVVISADTDAEAIKYAVEVGKNHVGTELWLGTHLVRRSPLQNTRRESQH
jgi:hypothetical protein